MKRIYTEIRIHHQSAEEKEQFERQLDDKAKTAGFNSRAEYIRVLVTNASIRVATVARRIGRMAEAAQFTSTRTHTESFNAE